jgi:hypothetical protein
MTLYSSWTDTNILEVVSIGATVPIGAGVAV